MQQNDVVPTKHFAKSMKFWSLYIYKSYILEA